MKSGYSIVGIALLVLGGLMFLGMFGVNIGGLIAFVISLVLMIYGYRLCKRASGGFEKLLGITMLIIGIIIFLGALPFLIGLAISLLLVYFGWRLMKKEPRAEEPVVEFSGDTATEVDWLTYESNFDSDWKKFLKRQNKDDDNN